MREGGEEGDIEREGVREGDFREKAAGVLRKISLVAIFLRTTSV